MSDHTTESSLFSNIRCSNLVEVNENDKDENATENTKVRVKRIIAALAHLLILQN